MKRLIVAALVLMIFLAESANTSGVHSVYLPIVSTPYEFAIDCMDENFNLVECE